MEVDSILFDILVVLVVAKIAAEVAERIRVPAVLGEIVAGVVIGPSALGIVEPNSVLATLAELGVILLLLDVGMEMDLRDLRSVGRAALGVAIVGVAVPFAAGAGASLALGLETSEAVFLGAALTATSVGITARVFGDLRALRTVEARTVLGAAVADDVIGLLILTVVARAVTEGSISVAGIIEITVLAVGFLVIATAAGLRFAPHLFRVLARASRSNGTLVAFALAFTLGLAELAHAVQLAPIIGAFVAGLVLARTGQSNRIRRELTPVGHLFIPVFFLHIGISADVAEFASPKVLGIAGALLAVAIVGKLLAAAGMFGAPGDRLLIGIGMVPRGEVGLIFATLGLREEIFGNDVYAALLLVVLATTLMTPPALRWRLKRIQAGNSSGVGTDLHRALLAARRIAAGNPEEEDINFVHDLEPGVRKLDEAAQNVLIELLHRGDPETWRVLAVSGVLHRSLPELAEVIEHLDDESLVDPLAAFRWNRVDQLRESGDPSSHVLVAALALDVVPDQASITIEIARATAERLGLRPGDIEGAVALVADAELLAGLARRSDGLEEEPVLELAAHIGSRAHLRDLAELSKADVHEVWMSERITALVEVIHDAIEASAEVSKAGSAITIQSRRDAALAELPADANATTRKLVETAPASYLLRNSAQTVARHVIRRAIALRRSEVKVFVDDLGVGAQPRWRAEFSSRDRVGLLARQARALSEFRADVAGATVVTWPGGKALASFTVDCVVEPDSSALERRVRDLFVLPLVASAQGGLTLEWDDHGSPWHTRCTVTGPDAIGALAAVTTAFAVSRTTVHSATIVSVDDAIADVFELTDLRGQKLGADIKERIESAVRDGSIRGTSGPRPRLRT